MAELTRSPKCKGIAIVPTVYGLPGGAESVSQVKRGGRRVLCYSSTLGRLTREGFSTLHLSPEDSSRSEARKRSINPNEFPGWTSTI